jgi:hypothetical protein
MTTVGYGDITPQNNFERIVADIFMLISGAVLSYTMNSISNVLESLNKNKIIYSRTINLINDYMIRNKVTFSL